jgi:hypothetical protein
VPLKFLSFLSEVAASSSGSSKDFFSDSVSAYCSPTSSCAHAKFDNNHVHSGPVTLTEVQNSTKSMSEETKAA